MLIVIELLLLLLKAKIRVVRAPETNKLRQIKYRPYRTRYELKGYHITFPGDFEFTFNTLDIFAENRRGA